MGVRCYVPEARGGIEYRQEKPQQVLLRSALYGEHKWRVRDCIFALYIKSKTGH
jgi:hypothetical protein